MPATSFVAADIGNARIKLGLFAEGCAAGLPEPLRTLSLLGKEPELDQVESWLAGGEEGDSRSSGADVPVGEPGGADIPVCHTELHAHGRQECLPHPQDCLPRLQECVSHLQECMSDLTCQWWIASVNRPAATRLIEWLHEHRPDDRVVLLASGDLPLIVRLERPDMVGIDRLVDAVAVNRLRDADRPAVIVDVGTAITVDLVSADGAFLGGAILPGIQMAARALHHFTDLLPLVDVSELASPPPALGNATVSAMKSGLFWGAVGAIRQLIEQLSKAASGAPPQVYLTGGAGIAVAQLLGGETCYAPNLTLSGIAQAAVEHKTRHAARPKRIT
jgi:type III pantothenate kinase